MRDSSQLDREMMPVLTLSLQARDRGNDPRAVTLPIELTLTDINDNTPQFSQASYSANVLEVSPLCCEHC